MYAQFYNINIENPIEKITSQYKSYPLLWVALMNYSSLFYTILAHAQANEVEKFLRNLYRIHALNLYQKNTKEHNLIHAALKRATTIAYEILRASD